MRREQLRLAAACVLALAPQVALAQGAAAEALGFYQSLDVVNLEARHYRLSVRHCRALENALRMLVDKHGWLIVDEMPHLVYEGDVIDLEYPPGTSQGRCPRPVRIDVDYDANDPAAAVDLLLAAYNGADPPYTVSRVPCGGHLCVVPAERRDAAGALGPIDSVLSTPVSFAAGPKTTADIYAGIAAQVQAATGYRVIAERFGHFDPSSQVTDQGFDAVPARQVLLAVSRILTQRMFEDEWARNRELAHLGEVRAHLGAHIDRHMAEGIAAGQTSEQIQASWEVRRVELEAQLGPVIVPPAPNFPPYVGPGGVSHTSVSFDPVTPGWVSLDLRWVSSLAEKTQCLPASALQAHLGHGDSCGACD